MEFIWKTSRYTPLQLSAKMLLVTIKIWVEHCFCYSTYTANRKSFFEVFHVTKLIILHTVVVVYCTHRIKQACLVTGGGGGGGKAVKMLKNKLL